MIAAEAHLTYMYVLTDIKCSWIHNIPDKNMGEYIHVCPMMGAKLFGILCLAIYRPLATGRGFSFSG